MKMARISAPFLLSDPGLVSTASGVLDTPALLKIRQLPIFIHQSETSSTMRTFDHRRKLALDWTLAIKRNRELLKDIVLGLFMLARMRIGGSLFTLPRSTVAMIMLVLRPAESAVRRLIVIAAQGLLASLSSLWGGVRGGGREHSEPLKNFRAFKLFDPLKSFDPEAVWDAGPVWESGFDLEPGYSSTNNVEDEHLDAIRIGQRLNALMRALDNLPAQARRLLKWQQKRDALLKAHRPTRLFPIRPGLPPGWRQRRLHEIDDVLRECHGLANDLLNAPDTS
jgi:hypothetical protein